jgi:glutathione peroxidase-family protein
MEITFFYFTTFKEKTYESTRVTLDPWQGKVGLIVNKGCQFRDVLSE